MKRYSLTTQTFTGDIVFTYNAAGLLVGIQINADLTDVACRWVFNSAPFTVERLMNWPIKNKTITEIK